MGELIILFCVRTCYGFGHPYGKMWLAIVEEQQALCGLEETEEGDYKLLVLIAF